MENDEKLLEEVDKIINDTVVSEKEKNEQGSKQKNNKPKKKMSVLSIVLIVIVSIIAFCFLAVFLFIGTIIGVFSNISELYNSDEITSYEDYDYDSDYSDYNDINYFEEDVDGNDDEDVAEYIMSGDEILNSKDKINYERFLKFKQNVEIKSSIGKNKRMNCEIKNNNNESLNNININVIYFDGEDKPIRVEEKLIPAIYPNKSYFCSLDIPETYENYERYEVFINSRYFGKENLIEPDLIEITSKEDLKKGKINVTIKNNAEKKIDNLGYSIIFYDKEGKIVDIYEDGAYELKKTIKEENYIPYDIEKDFQNYSYKINLNYAYCY